MFRLEPHSWSNRTTDEDSERPGRSGSVSGIDAGRLITWDLPRAYSIGRLKQHGDFGLGTFEGIDGEMTVLDGHFYHFRSDGIVTEEEIN